MFDPKTIRSKTLNLLILKLYVPKFVATNFNFSEHIIKKSFYEIFEYKLIEIFKNIIKKIEF